MFVIHGLALWTKLSPFVLAFTSFHHTQNLSEGYKLHTCFVARNCIFKEIAYFFHLVVRYITEGMPVTHTELLGFCSGSLELAKKV